MFRRLSLVLAVILLAAPATAVADCGGADGLPVAVDGPQVAFVAATVCLVNEQRAARGLRTLRLDAQLALAAHDHAADLLARGVLSHRSADGGDVAARAFARGYMRRALDWSLGEVLARSAGATPRQVVAAWLASPSHRRELLRRAYREIGLIALGGPGTTVVAAALGERTLRRARAYVSGTPRMRPLRNASTNSR